ncbi:MAG: TolC family protein [Christiangramia sp.]
MTRTALIILVFLSFYNRSFSQEEKKVWSLEDCLLYAEDHNLTITDALLDQAVAEVTYDQSKLQKIPSITGNISQSLTNGYSIDPITSSYINEQISSTSSYLNAQVSLFNGNKLNNQIAQNKLLVQQSNLFVEEAKNNIGLSIIQSYLQALYLKESISIARKSLENSQQETLLSKKRYEAGAIAKKDYSDARSQEAKNQYELLNARNNYSAEITFLKQLLNLPQSQQLEISEPQETYLYPVPFSAEQIYLHSLQESPSIQASSMNIAISEKDIDIAKADFLPSLSLSGSLGSGYTSIQDMNFLDQYDLNFNQRVGLALSIPIFNQGATKASVRKAEIRKEQANIALENSKNELYQNITTAWQNYTSAEEQFNAAKLAIDAAKDSYQLASKQFEQGLINSADLIVSQNNYTTAQQNHLQAKYMVILYSRLLNFYNTNQLY